MLYSYKGSEPEPLPFSIRVDDGRTFTSLSEYSQEDLLELGFSGPYTIPSYDENTQKVIWTGNSYEVIQLTEEELEKKSTEELFEKINNVDSLKFFSELKNSLFLKKIKDLSETNTNISKVYSDILSEFINSLDNHLSLTNIDNYLKLVLFLIEFTDEEKTELESILLSFGLEKSISLPDQKYLDCHYYDESLKKIIKKSPHKSWVWVDDAIINGRGIGFWQPPVQYPSDGNSYVWDETTKNWKLSS